MYFIDNVKRNKCVMCENTVIESIFSLEKMPVFMGVNRGTEEFFSDMTFVECSKCGTVQISEIINPNLLYMDNHNLPIVGKIWENHYVDFISFLGNDINDSTVLEIGDPSFKISNKLSKYSKFWYIVEINPSEEINVPENTKVIKKFFDSNFKIDDKIDIIIHSHFLEHVTDIKEHLKKVYDILNSDGKLIFSVPNLEQILLNGSSPNNVLHFEHSFFFTKNSLVELFKSEGFELENYKNYMSHSIFFKFKKSNKEKIKLTNLNYSKFFIDSLERYKEKIYQINDFLIKSNLEVFLYGAHISSQFLLGIGLEKNRISYILDNSKDKHGYCLYGTNILVKPTEFLGEIQDSIVIASHMSIYFDEIKEQILKINPNTIIL